MIHVLLGLVAAAIGVGLSNQTLLAIMSAAANFVLIALISYASSPVLAADFAAPYLLLILSSVIPLLLGFCFGEDQRAMWKRLGVAGGGTVAFLTAAFITTMPWFHAQAYRDLIGPIETTEFSTAVETLDQTQVRIVDQGLARRRAEEMLGNDPGLGSRAKVGTFTVQSVAGRLRWVAPLEPKGFGTWRGNDGTPGYVVVDAHNLQDAQLVLAVDGKPMHLRYTPEAWFHQDLHRHVYSSGNHSIGLTDYTFEIDDDGHPYWIATIYEKRVGMSGADAVGTLVIDPQTGAMTRYAIADAPAWIDRIQPSDMVNDQIDDHGEYVHGAFNWSGQDQLTSTEGIELVYGKDGRASWYVGIRSMGNKEGTTGFMLVDSRTKRARFFLQAGASELAAANTMQGAIANYKDWRVTSPILYNVNGQATYIATIKDGSGNFKGVAISSVASRSVVATGEDLRTALRAYDAALNQNGMAVAASPVQRHPVAGTIDRVGFEIIEGRTFFSLTIAERPELLIVVPAGVSPKTPLARAGDAVTMQIEEGDDGLVRATAFDLPAVGTRKSTGQAAVERDHATVEKAGVVRQEGRNADAAWRTMSPESKAEALRAVRTQTPK